MFGGKSGLGWCYQNGWGVKQDSTEAAEWFRKSAEQGNEGGQHGLGWLYQNGGGVKQDYAEAAKWHRKSAEQGNQHAQANLGYLLEQGLGVTKDYAEALQWYQKSSEQGNQYAQVWLGGLYFNGFGVKQDYAEAAKWYRKSAEQGNSGAQHMLDWLYWNGWGVKQDFSETARWLLKGAEQGNQHAQGGLGYLYQQGLGVKQDYLESERWSRKSAEQGNPSGQWQLGYLYENGFGVLQDYVEAYKWYLLSGAQNIPQGRQGMDRLRALMTKEQIAEAQKAAAGFKTASQTAPAAQPVAPQAPAPEKPLVSDADQPGFHLEENPENFAVVVGVEKYKDLPSAQFAERDAEAMRDYLLAMGYPERNVILLKGANATISGLKKYVDEWLPRNVIAGGTVFFYYSGHGAPDPKTGEAYLVPWDGDAAFLKSTAYPVRRLYASLNALKAGKVLVALDACFSGGGGRSVLARGARPLVTRVEGQLAAQGKLVLFAAASGDEITGTLEPQGHGLFTYFFLKGLNEQGPELRGGLNPQRLQDYLKPKVQDAARRQNRDQTPVLAGSLQN